MCQFSMKSFIFRALSLTRKYNLSTLTQQDVASLLGLREKTKSLHIKNLEEASRYSAQEVVLSHQLDKEAQQHRLKSPVLKKIKVKQKIRVMIAVSSCRLPIRISLEVQKRPRESLILVRLMLMLLVKLQTRMSCSQLGQTFHSIESKQTSLLQGSI